ncbi:Uncharacterised protein [Enterobacter hormaechei]|nr:Uncharacterised protein [Enterobacter hormaechei]
MAQHRTAEVFHHDFGRAEANGTQQSAISTQVLGTHHDAVCAQIFHRVDQLVEHGEGHGSAFDIDLLIVVHQLRNAVERFGVGAGVAQNQVAAECASQTFHLLTNLDCQLVVGVGHSGRQEFVDVYVACQDTQLRNVFGEGCSAFGDGVVHINEGCFAQGSFAVVEVCLRINLHERQNSEQVIAIDDGLDHTLLKFVVRQLFSFITQ